MKVISLLQPWASLVVLGHKKIETRSWNTKYRGELLIHASKKEWKPVSRMEALVEQMTYAGFWDHCKHIPYSAIIGKVKIDGVSKTENIDFTFLRNIHFFKCIEECWREKAFGDYSPNRYGWYLSDPVQFEKPIPCKGSLSIWNLPEALESLILQ